MKSCTKFVIAVMVTGGAIPAMANIEVTRLSLTTTGWTFQTGSGGEFQAQILSMPLPGLPIGKIWETFCLERNEGVATPSGNYYGVLNTAAVKGGSGGGVVGGNPLYDPSLDGDNDGTDSKGQSELGDPLDARTAYLFSMFAKGTLAGYIYDTNNIAGRKASAYSLQQAIWVLEGEQASTTDVQANSWILAANQANPSGMSGVKVLNLYTGYNASTGAVSGLRQDILVLVPAPGAALLALIGLPIVGWVRRRLA